MKIEKVIIIIPTYNEAKVIKETLLSLFAVINTINDFDIHVLVFDSASEDNTQNIVTDLQQNLNKLYLRQENFKSGLGSAYLQAMRYAMIELQANIVFEFDADLSHQPRYIISMLALMKTYDVVVGSRYIHGGSTATDWNWRRKLLSKFGNSLARMLLISNYMDLTSGFRAIRSTVLTQVLPKQFLCSGYAYKLQLMWLLHCYGAKICEYPIEFVDREYGISKLPHNSIVESLYVIIYLRLQWLLKKLL